MEHLLSIATLHEYLWCNSPFQEWSPGELLQLFNKIAKYSKTPLSAWSVSDDSFIHGLKRLKNS